MRPRTVVPAQAWLAGNTMKIQLGDATNPLTDPDTGAIITTATVTAVVVDEAGNELDGETWPLAMAHVGGGTLDGVYRGYATYLVEVVHDVTYRARITADAGGKRYYADVEVLGTRRSGATATT